MCMECIYNQDIDRNLLITQFTNNIFKVIIENNNNSNSNIYGFFIKGINNDNEIYLYINKYIINWEKISDDLYFEIILLNEEKIKIYIKNIKRYYAFINENYTIFVLDKNYFKYYSIHTFEYDDEVINNDNENINDYNNEIIIIPSN